MKKSTFKNLVIILINTCVISLFAFLISCKSAPTTRKNSPKVNEIITNPAYANNESQKSALYKVIGLSEITDSGRQVAYDQALEHGFRKAVEKALGVYLEAQTIVKNQTLLEDNIYARSYGFVEKYQIEKTWIEETVLYHRLNAWVVLADVQDNILALDLIQDRANRPYLKITIDETNFNQEKINFAEKEISKGFLKQQFKLVTSDTFSSNNSLEDPANFPAEIAIKGEVVSRINDLSKNQYIKNSTLKSVTTSLSLQAVNLNDKTIITTFSKNKSAIALNEDIAQQKAITTLSVEATDYLIDEILTTWDKASNNGFEYQVFFNNLNYQETLLLQEFINQKIQGVKKVFAKGFENNTLQLLIRFSGNATSLASYLASLKNPISLQVENYNARVISLIKK